MMQVGRNPSQQVTYAQAVPGTRLKNQNSVYSIYETVFGPVFRPGCRWPQTPMRASVRPTAADGFFSVFAAGTTPKLTDNESMSLVFRPVVVGIASIEHIATQTIHRCAHRMAAAGFESCFLLVDPSTSRWLQFHDSSNEPSFRLNLVTLEG